MADSGPRPGKAGQAGQAGQATAEFALVLPVLALLLLGLVQIGLVARDEVLLWGAAREAGRNAALGPDETDRAGIVAAAALAAPGLSSDRLTVTVSAGWGSASEGDTVEVTVRYRSRSIVPLLSFVTDLDHGAKATFRVE